MCDTISKILNEHYAIFGKNSDRAVNEPQVVEYYKAQNYDDNTILKTTYIEIPQVRHTNAIVLSRPTWLWGGEIGVNEYGVVIGNEAVFTKGKYGKESLIGMDLLRLGLERGNTAKEALKIIVDLLQEYGQGGNCGYDSDFHYNNSFLIMDRNEIYVLDTKDKEYTYKKEEKAAISNCLNIQEDGDYYSNENCNFYKLYSDFIMTTGSKAKIRRASSSSQNLDNLLDMMKILSSHTKDNVFSKGSVGSVCMHASNSLTADETTMSMIVELKDKDIIIWLTGSSLPCVSFFKPHHFGANGLISDGKGIDIYWKSRENYNRKLIAKVIPNDFYLEKELIQKKIIEDNDYSKAIVDEKCFYAKYNPDKFETKKCSLIYRNFWNKKNKLINMNSFN